MDHKTGTHRGFAFVKFELADDAADAMDNMEGAELLGKVLKVNVSKPMQGNGNRAVWEEDADAYFEHGEKVEAEPEAVERWRDQARSEP